MAALSGGSPFDTPSRKDPALETLGASLREQFVSARALRVCLPPHIHLYADRHVSVSLGAVLADRRSGTAWSSSGRR
jgi:hypothetical protein